MVQSEEGDYTIANVFVEADLAEARGKERLFSDSVRRCVLYLPGIKLDEEGSS